MGKIMKIVLTKNIIIISMCMVVFGLTACSTGNVELSSNTISPDNHDSTALNNNNKIEQMQKDVPFKIIVPSYLPDEFKILPIMLSKHTDDELGIVVDIDYYVPKSPKEFSIEEYLLPEFSNPDLLPQFLHDYTIIDINGTQIFERKSMDEKEWNRNTYTDYSYDYIWISNKIYVMTSFFKFDQDESERIVESMINQK
jgi:hypothetical protein